MFKPPVSIVNKIKENQNMQTVAYDTQRAADEMYKRDPVVQHNLENFTGYDPRFTGLVSNKDTSQLWEQPFEPIVGHTGLDVFPEIEGEAFQRKMEMFTGQDKTRFFSQKEAVVNDPRLMAPSPILNTAVPNSQERIEFYKQGLLRQGNVKPFESQLVGARHIQPLFRPLPKVGAERTVNPKKTLEYQTVTPPKSHVDKGTLAAQTFKNKVERAFAMNRLGFTTTGAVVKPAQYGTVDNKFQNRPETAPTGEQIFRNISPFNNQALNMKGADNYTINTAKESLQQPYTGNASSFNNQSLAMKGADVYSVNTVKESIMTTNHTGNATPFNNQSLAMKGADNYTVNTQKENVMTTNHTGNATPFNNVEAHTAPLGAAHFANKDAILKGRAPTMCGPSITNVDVNVACNKRKQLLNVRNYTNGGTTTTERLTSSYKVKNSEIDISSRLDPCLNIPMLDNPYANAFLS